MIDRPVVSIIITNYNYGRFLPDAISSALEQSYPSTEVIVVDDGSTDDSRQVIEACGKRVSALFKPNGGMASTYNAGFRVARGQIIIFLDSDDVLAPTAVERVVQQFSGDDISKVHWPLWETDGSGQPTGGTIPRQALLEGDFRDTLIKDGPDAYLSPPTSGNAWSRHFLGHVLPMPEPEFRQHADTYLTTLAPLYGRVVALSEPKGSYRIHGQNDFASKTAAERNERNLAIYDQRCSVLLEHLQRLGIRADPQMWKVDGSPYDWMRRLQIVVERIAQHVPDGASYILIDDAQLADSQGGTELVTNRHAIPFLEHEGQFWGPPPDDRTAIQEVERLRQSGTTFVVVAWPAFWWLDYYSVFARYLRDHFRCVIDDRCSVMFDLRSLRPQSYHRQPNRMANPMWSRRMPVIHIARANHDPSSGPDQNLGSTPWRGETGARHLIQALQRKIDDVITPLLPEGTPCALLDFPNYANVGDSAIWLGERRWLRRHGFQVVYACDIDAYSPELLAEHLGSGVILVNGGGNFGDLWPQHQRFRERVIASFPRNRIIQLPQSIHFDDPRALANARQVLSTHPDLTLLCRDRRSLEVARNHLGVPALLCPDMAFALGPLRRPSREGENIIWLARTDKESRRFASRQEADDVETVDWIDEPVTLAHRRYRSLAIESKSQPSRQRQLFSRVVHASDALASARLRRGSRLLSAGKVVVTDRLHGHILSILLGIPHVVLDNSYGKIKGYYDAWTCDSDLAHWVESPEDAIAIARRLVNDP